MPVLILNSNGDGFRWGAAEATDGKAVELVDDKEREFMQKALECRTHEAVLAFLDYHRDQLGDQGTITLRHDHHKKYIRHNWGLLGQGHGVSHACSLAEMRAFVEQRKVDTNPKIKKRDRLATLIFSKSILEIRDQLSRASVHVNFWGQRLVTFHGYEGSISLDRVAKALDKIAKKPLEQGDLTKDKRLAGKSCAELVAKLYQASDGQLKVKSLCTLITRIFNWVREISLSPYTPRFCIETGAVAKRFITYRKMEDLNRDFPGKSYENIVGLDGKNLFIPLLGKEFVPGLL